jgi:hypothetical protein
METIHSYRHVIDSNVAKLFEGALREVLNEKKLKNIGFVGLVLNYAKKEHHDIDVLIFPSENAKIGETLIELASLYTDVEKILKKKHERYYLATCTKKTLQELVYYLASLEEGAPGLIPIHSLFFPDYKSFKKFNPAAFEKEINKNLITLYGDFDVIHRSKYDISQEQLEPYFIVLDFEMSARIKTFPRHNIRASAESLFHYLKDKYGIKVTDKIPHDVKEIEKEIIKLMREIDKVTYS